MKTRASLLFVLLVLVCTSSAQTTLDLIIGNSDGVCYAYQNTGTPASPVWTARPAWNVPDAGSDTAPCYGDLDNDGDWDLLVGEDSGECHAFENTGTVNAPVWVARPAWNIPNFSTDARPIMGDFDNDCDYDAFVGENFGVSYFFRNTGSPTSPIWNSHNPLDLPDLGDDTRPAAVDLDGDGDLDVLVGEDDGVCYAYENIGTIAAPNWIARPAWNTPDVGTEAAPTVGDLDGDGDYDLIVGTIVGTNRCIENIGSAAAPLWAFRPAWDPPAVGGESEPMLLDLDDVGNTNALCLTLPVELIHFYAQLNGNQVELEWQTASEIQNDYFVVEHSVDGINWVSITTVKGMGNSSVGKYYTENHDNPVHGVNYYRLKQVDYDGTFALSQVQSVDYESSSGYLIYPNPALHQLNINWKAKDFDDIQIEIFDLTGRLLLAEEINGETGENESAVSLQEFSKGTYLVRLSSGNLVLLQNKLIKQ